MSIRILLADDHEIMRNGLHALLFRMPDMEVVSSVADGKSALQEAARSVPDVAVLDVRMPGMDGIETTRRLKSMLPHIKVLCLSMHRNASCVKAALEAGASGYLLKDSAVEELATAIRTVSEGKTYLNEDLAKWLNCRNHSEPKNSDNEVINES